MIQVAFPIERATAAGTSHENFSLRSSDFENEALITHRLGFDSRLPGSFLECRALIEPDAKSSAKSPHFMSPWLMIEDPGQGRSCCRWHVYSWKDRFYQCSREEECRWQPCHGKG